MTQPVTLRRLALAEFHDAVDWYERRRAGRGAVFTRAVRKVVATLGVAADTYPEVRDDVREAEVPGFPYAIYYRVREDSVDVIAVFHTSRDPAGWQGRA